MAGYKWYYNDNDAQIKAGVDHKVNYGDIIQNPDKFGGRNVEFKLEGSLNIYHIHFKGNEGKKVNTIRFKSDSNAEGDNIVVFDDKADGHLDHRESLKSLSTWCQSSDYPNHATLLSNLLDVIPW